MRAVASGNAGYHREGPKKPARGGRRGAMAVELAVVAPFLVFLFLVGIDYARVFYYQLTIENCARNGALFGSSLRSYQEKAWVSPNNDITKATLADGGTLSPPLDSSDVHVTNGTGSDGNANITVSVDYPFTTLTGFPGLSQTFTLHAQVSMRVAP
jgi:Flp pilus assembly protein TadG